MRRAQVASQQGSYLANLFNAKRIPPTGGTQNLAAIAAPFKYHHSGSFAYIGGDRAVLEVASNPGAAPTGLKFAFCIVGDFCVVLESPSSSVRKNIAVALFRNWLP